MSSAFLAQLEAESARASKRMNQIAAGTYNPQVRVRTHGIPPRHTHTDCRDETGITVGLLDSLITICRVLAGRDLGSPAAQEAVRDLASDADFRAVVRAAFRP